MAHGPLPASQPRLNQDAGPPEGFSPPVWRRLCSKGTLRLHERLVQVLALRSVCTVRMVEVWDHRCTGAGQYIWRAWIPSWLFFLSSRPLFLFVTVSLLPHSLYHQLRDVWSSSRCWWWPSRPSSRPSRLWIPVRSAKHSGSSGSARSSGAVRSSRRSDTELRQS